MLKLDHYDGSCQRIPIRRDDRHTSPGRHASFSAVVENLLVDRRRKSDPNSVALTFNRGFILALTSCLQIRFLAAGKIPDALRNVPEPVLKGACNAVSSALIIAARKRFNVNVPAAYARWAQAKQASPAPQGQRL